MSRVSCSITFVTFAIFARNAFFSIVNFIVTPFGNKNPCGVHASEAGSLWFSRWESSDRPSGYPSGRRFRASVSERSCASIAVAAHLGVALRQYQLGTFEQVGAA